jgi:hypothetical protein
VAAQNPWIKLMALTVIAKLQSQFTLPTTIEVGL